jgi:hypothetical protein
VIALCGLPARIATAAGGQVVGRGGLRWAPSPAGHNARLRLLAHRRRPSYLPLPRRYLSQTQSRQKCAAAAAALTARPHSRAED